MTVDSQDSFADTRRRMDASYRREQKRIARIQNWRERQRKDKQWFSFVEITDWCAREAGSIKRDDAKLFFAYERLVTSILQGDFEPAGQCRVQVLSPKKLFMLTRAKAQSQVEIHSDLSKRVFATPGLVKALLSHCWIPADLCRQWFRKYRIPEPPGWFDAISSPSAPAADAVKQTPLDQEPQNSEGFEPPRRPEDGERDDSDAAPLLARSGAKAQGIKQAIGQLWPNGIPKGLCAKERDRMIIDEMKRNGSSLPKSPARAIQRALKA